MERIRGDPRIVLLPNMPDEVTSALVELLQVGLHFPGEPVDLQQAHAERNEQGNDEDSLNRRA